MFGNKKMYKKGLADAMQAYEGFSEKQQAALEQLRQQVASGTDAAFDGLSEDLNGIYQYLSSQEKAALYQLDKQMDLKELEDQERRLLLAVLYQLAEDEGGEVTEAQRAFIRSVQRYMEVANPQTGVDLSVVGEIDSLDVQKLFLRVVLEFFYLRDGDEITEEQEEFLSNFSVNKKQASAIEDSVSRLYNIVGAEGIAEKYGYVAEEEATPAPASDMPGAPVEPIGLLRVTFPEGYLGSIIGDLNNRRGRVMEIEDPDSSGFRALEAEVPMARMMDYETRLCSMTQGRGTFTCKFLRYEKLSLGVPVAAAGESAVPETGYEEDEKTEQDIEVIRILNISSTDEKVFKNKHLILATSQIDIQGRLVCMDCTIELDYTQEGCEFISTSGTMGFTNCTFCSEVNASFDEYLREYFVFTGEAVFNHCLFRKVNCTIGRDEWERKKTIIECMFSRCSSVEIVNAFVSACKFNKTASISVHDTEIRESSFLHLRASDAPSIIRAKSTLKPVLITGCTFRDLELKHPVFIWGTQKEKHLTIRMEHCHFEDCRTSVPLQNQAASTLEMLGLGKLFKKSEYIPIIDTTTCTGLNDVKIIES